MHNPTNNDLFRFTASRRYARKGLGVLSSRRKVTLPFFFFALRFTLIAMSPAARERVDTVMDSWKLLRNGATSFMGVTQTTRSEHSNRCGPRFGSDE